MANNKTDYRKMGLLWVDTETTGLDIETDLVLEIAWMITGANGESATRLSKTLVRHPGLTGKDLVQRILQGNPIVRQMHHQSGLLAELQQVAQDEEEYANLPTLGDIYSVIDWELREAAKTYTEIRWAGNGVHFDRSFLLTSYGWKQMNRVLSHRILDVSSTFALLSIAGLEPEWIEPVRGHRAANDVAAALSTYLNHVDHLQRLTPQSKD